ncbi:MFS transporter [Halothiobacillus sp. DCM-1]|uniref:MFS transporter n=1 Tax=Halothiobacillus sp. DCM-1 TaxID=3112558 RepID=UPI003248BBDD
MNTAPLSLPRLLAYGTPGLPLAMLGLPLYVFLPAYYANNLGLGLAAVGLALMLARIWDVVLDPLIGFAADWVPAPHRRKKMMVAGLVPFLIALHVLLQPPADAGLGTLYVAAFLGFAGWSLVTLPYQSLGAEADPTPLGRARLASAREGLGLVGVLCAAALPILFPQNPAAVLQAVFYAVLILLPLSTLLLLWTVPEPIIRRQPPALTTLWPMLRTAPALRRLLAAVFLNNLANGIPAVLFVLYVEHFLQAPGALGWLLLLYFGSGILALPAWVWLARRLGSQRAWGLSIGLAGLSFAVVPALGSGQLAAFTVICLLSGLSLGADLALPAALQGDLATADDSAAQTERVGLYYGVFGLVSKLALAAATGLAFGLLSLAGYTADSSQTAALAWIYGATPVLFKLVAGWLVWRQPWIHPAHRSLPGDRPHASRPSAVDG